MLESVREMFIVAKQRKYPANTLKSYNSDIKIFLDNIMIEKKCNEQEAIKSVTPLVVERFINDNKQLIRDNSYSKSSLNRKLASLTLFYDWLIDMELLDIKNNPFKKIDRYADTEPKQKDILSIDEVKEVIKATYIRRNDDRLFYFVSARTRLLVSLMATTGMRIEEVLNIKLGYVEPVGEDYIINIPSSLTKSGEPRRVPLCGIVTRYYKEYLNEREKIKTESDLLILSNKFKKLSTKDSRFAIKKYVERIGISDRNIGNHSFRHIFRSVATEKNTNEGLICCISGWSRKRLGTQSEVYLHDDERLDNIKIEICKNIL